MIWFLRLYTEAFIQVQDIFRDCQTYCFLKRSLDNFALQRSMSTWVQFHSQSLSHSRSNSIILIVFYWHFYLTHGVGVWKNYYSFDYLTETFHSTRGERERVNTIKETPFVPLVGLYSGVSCFNVFTNNPAVVLLFVFF